MKLKTIPIPPIYNFGDTRITRKYAWWPKQVEDKLIWLESYELVEIKANTPRVMWIGKYPILCPWGWDFVEEKLITKQSGLPELKNAPPPPIHSLINHK